MKKTTSLRATLLAATLVVAGYGGMKAYDYSYGKRVSNKEKIFLENVEAITRGEIDLGYDPVVTPCPKPMEYKSSVKCGFPKEGGEWEFCSNSDCG